MKRLPPLNALLAFVNVAKVGSFTKAAENMNVTQSAVSRQVKNLEVSMGVNLFLRGHQSIRLTPIGKELAETLSDAFGIINKAVEKSAISKKREQLSINVPPTFATRWLAPRIQDFLVKYPFLDLSVTTDNIKSIRVTDPYDCLVIFDKTGWPKTKSVNLMLEHHVMASSPSLWRGNVPPTLKNATLLHILDGDERLPVWEGWLSGQAAQNFNQPVLNFSTLDQAINASVAGAGIVVVDKSMIVNELKTGLLKRFDSRQINGPFGYWFIETSHSPDKKKLVAIFQEWLLEQI
jgi:LysR family glycine cleavage system transcriptional activator